MIEIIELLLDLAIVPSLWALLGLAAFLAGYEIGWRDGQRQA